jgi:hypothetical protein
MTPLEIAPDDHENETRGESGAVWEEEALGGRVTFREDTDNEVRAPALSVNSVVKVSGCMWLYTGGRYTKLSHQAVQRFVARDTLANRNRSWLVADSVTRAGFDFHLQTSGRSLSFEELKRTVPATAHIELMRQSVKTQFDQYSNTGHAAGDSNADTRKFCQAPASRKTHRPETSY